MNKRLLNLKTLTILIILIALLFAPAVRSHENFVLAQSAPEHLRFVRSIFTGEFGLTSPKGMAFSPTDNSFILFGSDEASMGSISLYEAFNGTGSLSGGVDNYLDIAFDEKSGALFVLNQSSSLLSKIQINSKGMPVNAVPGSQYSVSSLNLKTARGVTFDPSTGRMFVLNGDPARLTIVTPDAVYGFDGGVAIKNGRVRQIPISVKDANLQGVAFNPVNKHLYIGGPDTQVVYEVTEQGTLVTVYDLSKFNLKNPGSMLFAPSGDITDDPATMNLYILDLGSTSLKSNSSSSVNATSSVSKTQDTQIIELSLIQAASLPPGTTLIPAVLEHTIDASNASWNPSAPDTAGVAYWPSQDKLFIVDSEVDEMPNYFAGKNVYLSTRSGTLVSTCSTTSFNNEPTGSAINPNNNHIFISADNNSGLIFEIDLGSDGIYCTSDDVRTTLSLSFITGMDAEDVAYGQNTLFIADGINSEVHYFNLGANGVIGGGDDGPISHFDTGSLGFTDLEGLGYSVYNGTLLLVANGGSEEYIGETNLTGTLLRAYDLSFLPAAPHSDVDHAPGSINPSLNNFYVASRGVDNNQDPNENDGKIWEIRINTPYTSTPSRTPTWTPTATATNTLDPNGTATFTPTSTFTPTATFTATPLPSTNPLLASFTSNGSVGGISFSDEDILRFNGTSWSLLFDGSDVGVGGVDVFGFYVVDNDTFLMSFDRNVTVNGMSVTPSDIVQFDAISLGSVTAGSFSMYFNGVDVGLDTTAEKIDGVDVLPDGRILISTTGNPSVPNGAGGTLAGADEDILAFTPTILGNTTSGSWAMYFDGSDVGLADSADEDIDALDVSPNGDIFLSTLGVFSVPGVSGDDEDVFRCTPTSLGSNTACIYSSPLYFDGSTWGFSANDIDGLGLEVTGPFPTATPSNTPTHTSTPTATATPSNTPTHTNTPTATFTATIGPSPTPTNTFTPTATFTPSNTPTHTSTPTATFTSTNTFTPTATFTPSPTSEVPDLIFADGFESGDLSAWTSSSTNNGSLSVNATSALVGSYGMQVVLSGQTNMYVRDDSPVAEARYRTRFYFDPNSLSMVNGDYIYLLQGYATTTNTIMLRMEFKNVNGVYQARLKALSDSGTWLNTAYITLTDGPHVFELDWLAASVAGANDGQATFWIDDVQTGSLTGIDNDTFRMESVRLGAPYLSSATMSGSIYFDSFESRRQTYIGP